MRVLYLVGSAGIGGAETVIMHTALHHEVKSFYLLFREGVLSDWFSKNYPKQFAVIKPFPRLSHPINFVKTVWKIIQYAKKNNIELIHSTMAYCVLFGGPASKFLGLPHVWFQHGPVSGWMDQVAGLMPANLLLVNSRFTKKQQENLEIKIRFIPRRPIKEITLGADLAQRPSEKNTRDMRQELEKKFNIEKPIIATMLCRFQDWKGVHLFLEAMEKAHEIEPKLIGFLWGEFPNKKPVNEYELKLEAQIQQSKAVQLMGQAKNPLLALAASDILVNASIRPEPFGLSIVEAMAVGTVPIVPKEGGPLDIIEDGESGLFFEPMNVVDLKLKLLQLAGDKKMLEKLGYQAKALAEQKFNSKSFVNELENIYRELLPNSE